MECEKSCNRWLFLQPGQCGCLARNVNITTRQEVLTMNGKTPDEFGYDMVGFEVNNQQMSNVPSGLGHFFPKIIYLRFHLNGLEEIQKKDLAQFPKIQWFYLSYNPLNYLPGDLFEGNPDLMTVDFQETNHIKRIGQNLVVPLTKVNEVSFASSGCLIKYKWDGKNVTSFQKVVNTFCPENKTIVEAENVAE